MSDWEVILGENYSQYSELLKNKNPFDIARVYENRSSLPVKDIFAALSVPVPEGDSKLCMLVERWLSQSPVVHQRVLKFRAIDTPTCKTVASRGSL